MCRIPTTPIAIAVLAMACSDSHEARTADAPVLRAEGTPIELVPLIRPEAPSGAHLALELLPDHASNSVRMKWDAPGFGTTAGTARAGGAAVLHLLNGADPTLLEGSEGMLPARPGRNVLFSCVRSDEGPVFSGPGTYVLTEFTMRGQDMLDRLDLGSSPCLFLISPTGQAPSAALLDVITVNCTLAPNAYRIRATLDGHVFMIEHAYPLMIEGLAQGNHAIRLELLDPNGGVAPGPFSDTGVRGFRI